MGRPNQGGVAIGSTNLGLNVVERREARRRLGKRRRGRGQLEAAVNRGGEGGGDGEAEEPEGGLAVAREVEMLR